MEITLDMLLDSRDKRSTRQKELIQAYPECRLVCLTVVMPGNVKRNLHSLVVAGAAVAQMAHSFAGHIIYFKAHDLPTGYEAYLMTDLDSEQAKRLACDIEDNHPLGRLMDIDVMGADGAPTQRQTVGKAARSCLLCDQEARYCMRNHTHTQQELHECIDKMIASYV